MCVVRVKIVVEFRNKNARLALGEYFRRIRCVERRAVSGFSSSESQLEVACHNHAYDSVNHRLPGLLHTDSRNAVVAVDPQ